MSYSLFLLILRQGNADARRPAGSLFDATLTAAAGSAVAGVVLGDLDWVPAPESQAWLVLLALSSQVLGWLLISVWLPRLPALHRDPFDRILVSQAIVHGLVILTPDPLVTQYPARTAW